MHAVHAAGDALVAISLAGTLFFSVPLDEARSRVALYLLITMLPFALLAPVAGPVLDHFRHGRRYALSATMLLRAALVWAMAGAVDTFTLYPAAFGVLVLSRSYGVARSAAVPRLLPVGMSLVKANARLSLAALALGATVAPIGLGVSRLFGYSASLRLAAAVFLLGTLLAMRLPEQVDSAPDTGPRMPLRRSRRSRRTGLVGAGAEPLRLRLRSLPSVVAALRAAVAVRALVGLLTLFLAFLLRQQGGGNQAVVALVVAATLGSAAGTVLGARLRDRAPDVLLTVVLGAATVSTAAGAVFFSPVVAVAVATSAAMAGSLAKLALDAVLQRDVPERNRSSAFARSETVLQLAWVGGGGVGIALPLVGSLGMAVASAWLAGATVLALLALRRLGSRPARPPGPVPAGREGSPGAGVDTAR